MDKKRKEVPGKTLAAFSTFAYQLMKALESARGDRKLVRACVRGLRTLCEFFLAEVRP